MSYNNVGKVWSPSSFGEYLKGIQPPNWAKAVCLHHTASPDLAQRPKGWTIQHIINMKDFYKGMGWKSGPHFFTDEDQVFGMTPPRETGIHAKSFNSNAIGIEALGYYSKGGDNPLSGRGFQVWQMTADITRQLLNWLMLPVNNKTVLFHRDDPKTSKDCPGSQISKDWILSLILNDTKVPDAGSFNPIFLEKKIVPVAKTMASKGYSDAEIKKNLRKEGSDFFWLDKHIELAYYDAKLGMTFAPLSSLTTIPNK